MLGILCYKPHHTFKFGFNSWWVCFCKNGLIGCKLSHRNLYDWLTKAVVRPTLWWGILRFRNTSDSWQFRSAYLICASQCSKNFVHFSPFVLHNTEGRYCYHYLHFIDPTIEKQRMYLFEATLWGDRGLRWESTQINSRPKCWSVTPIYTYLPIWVWGPKLEWVFWPLTKGFSAVHLFGASLVLLFCIFLFYSLAQISSSSSWNVSFLHTGKGWLTNFSCIPCHVCKFSWHKREAFKMYWIESTL